MSLRPDRNFCSSRMVRTVSKQRHAVKVEDRLGTGLVAGLHAVAGQAEDVGHAHRGRAQHVALDGDAVPVAAGDLHDRRVAHAGEQRADADEDM